MRQHRNCQKILARFSKNSSVQNKSEAFKLLQTRANVSHVVKASPASNEPQTTSRCQIWTTKNLNPDLLEQYHKFLGITKFPGSRKHTNIYMLGWIDGSWKMAKNFTENWRNKAKFTPKFYGTPEQTLVGTELKNCQFYRK